MDRRRFLNSTVVTTVFAAKGLGQEKPPAAGRAAPEEPQPRQLPLIPLFAGPAVPSVYRFGRYEGLALTFSSTREMVAPFMPEMFKPIEPVTVTAYIEYYDQVEFLAARDYSEAIIGVPVRFDGERDHVQGGYAPIMFLSDAFPIIHGRELLGIPKLPADFSRIRDLGNGRLGCEISLWGHFLLGLEAAQLQRSPSSGTELAKRRVNLFGYKYIPSLEGPPDAAYPTSMPMEFTIESRWTAKNGRALIGEPSEEDVSPIICRVLNAVRKMTGGQFLSGSHEAGSVVLRMDLARRLR